MIYTIKDLLTSARRLPNKYRESMVLKLEDMEEQLKIWTKNPEDLTKNKTLHKGIKFLAEKLSGVS
jgi:hypothetical protein